MDAQTSAAMAGLDRAAQRIGLTVVESRNGRARRFAAWGREIEYVVLETGAVRASALMDDEIMATSTRSVEWMRQLMLKAKADQLSAAAAPAEVPSPARRRIRAERPEHGRPTAYPRLA